MTKTPRFVAWMLIVTLLAAVAPSMAFAAPRAQAKPYSGKIVQTFQNCGITQIFGVVLDAAGNPQPGVKLHLWWPYGPEKPLETTSGSYVRPETNAAGWDFTLNTVAVANTWYVAVVDGAGNRVSDPVEVRTSGSCNPGDVNVAKVEFRNVPAPAAPAPTPAAPAPSSPPADSGQPGVEAAPPITAGAECDFFIETGENRGGFSVCDDGNARFLTAFKRYGLQNVGYPISTRFKRDGFITQAFQKAIFQWRPDTNSVAFVNVFDELHRRGLDHALLEKRQTPHQLPEGWEGQNVPFQQAVQKRQGLLNVRPALRQAYFSVSNPLLFFGLPTSEVQDMGNHYAIRLQRAVLQEWKEDVPWARRGQVTVANGGMIAKELAHLPVANLVPETRPPTAGVPAPAPVAAPIPTQAPAAPVPAANEPPRNLDSRLNALGVSIEPANVAPGQAYWRVVEIIWHDENQAEGRHALQIDVLDESGSRVVGQPLTVSWGGGSARIVVENKPYPEYGTNFPMYRAGQSYSLQVDGLPSDKIHGLGLGDLQKRDWTIHVEYLIKYQKVIKR